MKKNIFIGILMLLWVPFHTFAQIKWSFDKSEILKSDALDQKLILHSKNPLPELVSGIKGVGLRTDGYTTWLTANFIPSKSIQAISAYFALESFPTDNAGIVSLRNVNNSESLSICVDRFGALSIKRECEQHETLVANRTGINRFQWYHIALVIDNQKLELFLNGVKQELDSSIKILSTDFNEVILGKDFVSKKLGIHELTAINGIIDELSIWENGFKIESLQKEISSLVSKTPRLAINPNRFENDFSRPKYHLLPMANWTNETHGLLYYDKRYHIFNQKNASNLFLGQINWGHFSSPDLLNWTEHKPAITPDKGYDKNGIWSGHAIVNDDNIPTLIYSTGGDKMGVGLAFPTDAALTDWKKFEGNPVISGQPEGYTRTDLRDQYVWKEQDTWYMIIGFGVESNNQEKGALLLYKSKDLYSWTFLHTLYEGQPEIDNSGIFWEMPVFWKYDNNKYILLVNKVPHQGVPARALYWSGEFKNERFVPDDVQPRNLEVINRLLSPSVAKDKDGLTTAIAIIPDEIGSQAAYEHGWTHLYSIPRVWNIVDGKIKQSPHPQLKKLRKGEVQIINAQIVDKETVELASNDQQVEVMLTIDPKQSKRFGFYIHRNADNSEYTKIFYDADTEQIVVDQRYSSLKKHIPLDVRADKYKLDLSKPVDFHVFVDGSVIEVFINNEDAFTTRIFPLKSESSRMEVFSEGGAIKIQGQTWDLSETKMDIDF